MTKSFKTNLLLAIAAGTFIFAAACSSSDKKEEPTPQPTQTQLVEASPTEPPIQTPTLPVPTSTTTAALTSERIQLSTNTSTRYYTVTGVTTAEIFDSIDKNGPRDDKGVKGSGLTAATWGYRWQPQPTSDGCVISSMTISLDIVVTLPRHSSEGSLSSTLAANWEEFEASVARHEQTHVDIDYAGARTIRDKMIAVKAASSCDALTRQVDTLWNTEQRAVEAAQDQFHAQEDARIAARRSPLQSQIDVNRTRITQLSGQIEGLDASLALMNSELTNVDSQLEALKKNIDATTLKYPEGDYPPSVFVEYNEWVRLYNALAPAFNQLVSQYNSSIAQRNNVADEHDDLVEATNLLVDDFNWTR